MTITISTPDGSKFNFPDGTSQDDINAAMDAHFGGAPKAPGEDVSAGMGLSGIPILGAYVPQAEAAIRAAANPLTGVGEPGATFSERYAKNLPLRQADYAKAEKESPVTSGALKVGGGVLPLLPVGMTALGARALGMTGPTMVGRIGAGAASGAALTAADAAARGESPVTGGEIGAATGAAGPLVGRLIGTAVQGARNLLPVSRLPQLTQDVAGVPVPITRGQATGDVVAQMEEQSALRGGLGEQPAQVARTFFEGQQTPAVERARQAIGMRLDRGGQPIATTPGEAAELSSESVRGIERQAKAGVTQAYKEAFALPGQFNAGAFEGVGQKIRGRLTLGDNPVIVDEVTTPIANRMLADVDQNIGSLRVPNAADPFGAPNPENIVGINLKGVDQARKRLVAMAGAAQRGTPDHRAATRIIGAFDDHIENAMATGLFSGDDRALDALRAARRASAQHRQTFRSRGAGDDVGRAMERIIGRNGAEGATPTEVANYLYGNARVGGTGLSVRLANRMRDVLGEASPEWAAIKQGLWARLTTAAEGAQQPGTQRTVNKISDFLNGSGRPLAQSMFSAEERALMRAYSDLQQQLTPRAGAVNFSNTAGVMRMIMARMAQTIGIGIGGFGGPLGAVAGAGIAAAGQRAIQGASEGVTTRGVQRLLRGSPRVDPRDIAFADQMARYGALAGQAAPAIGR